jgi:serine/threonine protein phosphatase PrpC
MSNQLFTQYDFLFAGSNEGGFVENYAYDLGEGNEHGGKIFINIDIQQNKVDADKVAEVIFDSMRRGFFTNLDSDPYERFEEALKEVNRALNAFRQDRDDEFLGKLNVIIAAMVGDQLFLTQVGEAEAYLIRKRFATVISDDLDESSDKEVFTNIASGDLEPGDFVLMASTRLLRYISKTDLAKTVHGNVIKSSENVKDFLKGEVLNKIGMILVQVVKFDDDEPAEKEIAVHKREEGFLVLDKGEEVEKVVRGAASSESGLGKAGAALNVLKKKAGNLGNTLKNKVAELTDKNFENERPGRTASGRGWAFSNWGKDKILIAIIVLLVILGLGIWAMRASAEEKARIEALNGTLVQIREEINSAITTGQFDKDRAGQMLASAETKAIEVYNSGLHKAKSTELLNLILETRDKLDGVTHVKPDLIADLSSKRSNVSALGLVKLDDRMFAYEYNALYPILADQVGDPLTIDDNEKVVSAVNYDDKDSILFLTESGKIIEYLNDRMSFLSGSEGAFKKGVSLSAFSNRIFILDPEGNQVWRYTRRRDTFDAPQAYAVGADLKNAVDMAIDGSIYILGDDSYITKLFQGNKEDFPISKQPVKPITSPTKIYTDVDMSQIYVLEPNESRVLVYLKDSRSGGAVYTAQYIFDEITDLKDIYVDKNTNTLYLLTSKAVYRTAL